MCMFIYEAISKATANNSTTLFLSKNVHVHGVLFCVPVVKILYCQTKHSHETQKVLSDNSRDTHSTYTSGSLYDTVPDLVW